MELKLSRAIQSSHYSAKLYTHTGQFPKTYPIIAINHPDTSSVSSKVTLYKPHSHTAEQPKLKSSRKARAKRAWNQVRSRAGRISRFLLLNPVERNDSRTRRKIPFSRAATALRKTKQKKKSNRGNCTRVDRRAMHFSGAREHGPDET